MQRDIGAEPERAISRGVLGDATCEQASYPAHRLVSYARYRNSTITRHPDFAWPNGKRRAVYIADNLEHFDFAPAGHDGDAAAHPDAIFGVAEQHGAVAFDMVTTNAARALGLKHYGFTVGDGAMVAAGAEES
jgi:hypothetical protein